MADDFHELLLCSTEADTSQYSGALSFCPTLKSENALYWLVLYNYNLYLALVGVSEMILSHFSLRKSEKLVERTNEKVNMKSLTRKYGFIRPDV